jgi:hypothetical protein
MHLHTKARAIPFSLSSLLAFMFQSEASFARWELWTLKKGSKGLTGR